MMLHSIDRRLRKIEAAHSARCASIGGAGGPLSELRQFATRDELGRVREILSAMGDGLSLPRADWQYLADLKLKWRERQEESRRQRGATMREGP